jgi:predicted porin
MKKSTVTMAALAAFASASFAQSSVTLYGKIDVGLVYDSGSSAGKSVRISSGVSGGSRLGFKGIEDLGGGYKAAFQLETGVCADSAAGAANFCTGGNFMGRQAHGDLSGPFGTMSAGRQYSLAYTNMVLLDPFGIGLAGDATNLIDSSGSRINNSFRYLTPVLSGLSVGGEISFGEQTGNWEAGREYGGLVSYASGPLYAGAAVYDISNGNAGGRAKRNMAAGGTYDFGVVKVNAMFQRTEGQPTGAAELDNDNWLAGMTVPLAGGSFIASYIYKNDRTDVDRDAAQIGVGYLYPLSKRTSVYTAFAYIDNRNGATYTVGNATEDGTGSRAFNFGVVSNF